MEEDSNCPICFGEYASSGDHRIVAMKCGHLFGQSCLMGWFGNKKKAICPTCTVPSTKSQLRTIFASKLSALGSDTEQKLLDKFLAEHNEKTALLAENKKLKAQIECLKLELANMIKEETDIVSFKYHSILYKKIPIQTYKKTIELQVIYDDVRNAIICTGFKNDNPAIYRYSSNTFDFVSLLTFSKEKHISNIIKSPFKDGIVLLSIDKSAYLINIHSFCTIYVYDIDFKITALSFNQNLRSAFYVADECGFVHFIDLDAKTTFKKKASDVSIHSICVVKGVLYVASVFKIYKIDLETLEVKRSSVDVLGVCTNMSTNGINIIFTFRNPDNTVGFYINETESYYNPHYKQVKRHKDKIIDNYIYLVNDEENALAVHDASSFEILHKYEFKEAITGFCVEKNYTIALTRLYLYVFK